MRIQCPGCEAAYEVPDMQVRPGRSVRCARCGLQWRPAGDPPETMASRPPRENGVRLRQNAVPAPAIDAGTKPAPGAAAVPGLRARLGLAGPDPATAGWGLGWVASLVMLAALLVSAAHWRAPIMQHWPPSIRLYTALGAQAPRS